MNEVGNVLLLVERIERAMRGARFEVCLVDDGSRDGTVSVARNLEKQGRVTVISRTHPTGGLSGAVLEGFKRARGDVFVVMDADLQHPPEAIPALIAPVLSGHADFVLGSRRVRGAVIGEHWALRRRLISCLAALLASPLVGRIADPMSGFFALSRRALERAGPLRPIGFKVALELLCKCRFNDVVEVPIVFAARHAGESKLTVREGLRFLRHLCSLYRYRIARGQLITQTALLASPRQ